VRDPNSLEWYTDREMTVNNWNKERRQFLRCEVSIPCTVTHTDETTSGKITIISQGGAFITELTTLPPPGKAAITVGFKVGKDGVEIKASVDSSVVHRPSEITSSGNWGSIGVQFQDHSREVQSQLKSLMRLLLS